MASEDDLEVKMRVVLDEEDIKKQAEAAAKKAGVDGTKSATGGPKPPPPPSGPASYKDIADAIAKSIRESVTRKAEGGALASLGQAALPIAGAFFALKILGDLRDAVMSVIRNLVSLASSLQKFSPVLSLAFREMSVEMRKIAIDMAQLLGPTLRDVVKGITEIVSTLYYALKPAIAAIAAVIRIWTLEVRVVVQVFRFFMKGVATAAWALTKLAEVVADIVAMVSPAVGAHLQKAAKALSDAAEKWVQSLDGQTGPGNLLNMMLLRGLSEASGQGGSRTRAAGDRHDAIRDLNLQERRERPSQQHSSLAENRIPVKAPAPRLANVITNMQHSTEVRVESEQAVFRAMEEVRRILTGNVMRIRDDQVRMANRLAAETVVDLVR